MKKKILFRLFAATICGTTLFTSLLKAQVALSGTNYTQNFDGIASGLPSGWSVRTGSTATSLGTAAVFNMNAVSWSTATGQFGNAASTTNNSLAEAAGNETSTAQSAFTNRCPAVRQGSSFGDPGAAFVFQIANTIGLSNLTFSIDLNMLSVQGHSTTWTIDYAVGDAPSSFTTLGTYSDPGVFGTTTQIYSLGTDANDQPDNIFIRVVALSTSTGSSSRDTFGIDNFILNYSGPSAPTIASAPADTTNSVLTTAAFSVAVSGETPLYYQWFKGTDPLSDDGHIFGSTNSTLIISNVLHADAADYSVIITNFSGAITSSVVHLTVIGFAIAPLSPTNTLGGAPVTVPLTFIDNQTPITAISGSSSNETILPDANISGTGGINSGSATLTPLAGTGGVVLVNLTASDGNFSTNIIFPLLVVPSTNVVFNDHFDYANGSLTANSFGIWKNYSGPAGQLTETNGTVRVSRTYDEDANASLIGEPFDTNAPTVLYSRFTIKINSSGDLPTATGNYFAHFKDTTTSNFCCRVWASTANTVAPNSFRLGIGNANTSTANTAQFPLDLTLTNTYTVVTRLVLSNGICSLWINPTSETDTSVTANDAVTTLVAVSAFAFREDGSEGNILADDLIVGTSFAAVAGNVSPIPLNIYQDGTNVVLTWNDSSFTLQAAPDLIGTFTNVPDATSPFTNNVDSPVKFYRLAH